MGFCAAHVEKRPFGRSNPLPPPEETGPYRSPRSGPRSAKSREFRQKNSRVGGNPHPAVTVCCSVIRALHPRTIGIAVAEGPPLREAGEGEGGKLRHRFARHQMAGDQLADADHLIAV